MILDYSYARPDPAAMKAAGAVAVMRYLSPTPAKNLSAGERDALHGAGLGIGLVWESWATRAAGGFGAGRADAIAANAQADALGYPTACPIFYAVDFAATIAQVGPYFQGVESVGHRPVGVYGSAGVVEGITAPYKWQTVAWSGGRISPMAHLYQRATGAPIAGTDVNDPLRPMPLWTAPGVTTVANVVQTVPGAPITPTGTLPAPIQEEPMARLVQVTSSGSYYLIGELICQQINPDYVTAAGLVGGAPLPVLAADLTRFVDIVNANRKQVFASAVDTAALAAAVVAGLPAPGAGLTSDAVTAAVKAAIDGLTLTVKP